MANVKMARQGSAFMKGGVNIAWPYGRDESEIAAEPEGGWSGIVQQAVLNGFLEWTDDAATVGAPLIGVDVNILTGADAVAKLHEPPPGEIKFGSDPETAKSIAVPEVPQMPQPKEFSTPAPGTEGAEDEQGEQPADDDHSARNDDEQPADEATPELGEGETPVEPAPETQAGDQTG